MASFNYRAVNTQGEVQTGQMAASSEAGVITQLQAMGLIPISAELQKSGASTSGRPFLSLRKPVLGYKEVGDFTRQLSTLVGAGLSLDRSLDIIGGVSSNPLMVELIDSLQTDVRSGKTLSDALREHPH